MAWIGSAPNQTYQRTDGVRTGAAVCTEAKNAAVNDTAALADVRENDFATALNLVLKRDGGNAPTANLPMNSQKFTGLAVGSARTDSVRLDQVQDGGLFYAEAGGTANAITLTTAISCTPVEGMQITFFAEFDNTTATTVTLNGGSALALQVGGAACVGGEVNNGQFHIIGFDGTQWQIGNPYVRGIFQPLDTDLTAIAALTSAADKVPYATGAGTWALADLTTAGRALIDDASASAMRTTLGLAIGSDVQAFDADLTTLGGLAKTKGNLIAGNGTNWAAIGVGTDGMVLTADSSDAEGMVWGQPGLKFIGNISGVSVAAVDVDLDALAALGAREVLIRIDYAIPATDDVMLGIRVSHDGGSTFVSSAAAYVSSSCKTRSDGATASGVGGASTFLELTSAVGDTRALSNTVAEGGWSGEVRIDQFVDPNLYAAIAWHGGYMQADGAYGHISGAGRRQTADNITDIRFLMSSGNIAAIQGKLFALF